MRTTMVKKDNDNFRILAEQCDEGYRVIYMKGGKGKLKTEIWSRKEVEEDFVDLKEQ